MEKFADYLISKSIIPENQIPYYIGWVKAFFRFLDKDTSENVTADEIDRYIKGLVKLVEAWQLKQARQAIQAFCFFQGQPPPNMP